MNRARDELEQILDQREYQIYYQDDRNFIQIWWDNAKSWLVDILNNWFDSLEQSTTFAQGILVIVTIIVLLGVIIAGIIGVRTIGRKRSFYDHQALHSIGQKEWTYKDHLTEADKQENLQQYIVAIRHLFVALLLYLDEKQFIEAQNTKTNKEYYEEIRGIDQKKAEHFFRIALVFDQVTYGKQIIEKKAFVRYRNTIRSWIEQQDYDS